MRKVLASRIAQPSQNTACSASTPAGCSTVQITGEAIGRHCHRRSASARLAAST
jgi:hypothetical protein